MMDRKDQPYKATTALNNKIKYLYKYRSLDEEDISKKYTERIITLNEIYFSSPYSFNDPFDSKCHIFTEGSYEKRFNNLYKRLKEGLPKGTSDEEIRVYASKMIYKNGDTHTAAFSYESVMNKMGICCLSANKSNILLWSHYANNHKGLCLQFSCKKEEPFFGNAEKVLYGNEYPIIDYLDSFEVGSMIFAPVPLTKMKSWSYEEEYRLFRGAEIKYYAASDHLPNTYGLYTFPEELLSGIIFGCKMEDDKKKMIHSWIKQRKTKPKLFQARMKNKEFGLDIILLK